MMEGFGGRFFTLLGGKDRLLEEAEAFSQVPFAGAVRVWLTNMLASVLVTAVLGGWIMVALDAPGRMLFALAAASMVVYGAGAALSVWLAHWGPEPEARKTR
jgi:hypothetical protein